MVETTEGLRVLRPAPLVYAFYDGRIKGRRLYSAEANWLDDGAYELGIASYALVDESDALIYDAHMSPAHGEKIRTFIERLGVRRMRLVVSHWHLDHVAGNTAFADCEIIANELTAANLLKHRRAIEEGTLHGFPAVSPLVLPNSIFEQRRHLEVGRVQVDLHHLNIHSDDATVVHAPELGLLLAGDTLEDTVTYVAEPQQFDRHLLDLDRMWQWHIGRILPNHGDPDIIAAGGYPRTLIRSNQQYVRTLARCVNEPDLRSLDLKTFIAGPLQAGWATYFEPYEAVHRRNVAAVLAAADQ